MVDEDTTPLSDLEQKFVTNGMEKPVARALSDMLANT
jgi:hypothetical protein